MKVFVTGVTGFVGRNLVEELVNKGYDVAGFLREDVKDRKPAVFSYLKEMNVELVYGDITNYNSVLRGLNNFSYCGDLIIVHLATLPSSSNYGSLYQVNVKGTENLYTAILEAGLTPMKIIHFSTASIFGSNHLNTEITENYEIFRPETSYEKTKHEGEKIAKNFIEERNLPITILRPVHVYGPHYSDPMLTRMIKMTKRGFVIGPPPTLPIDLVYVGNLVDATVWSIEKEDMLGETYLVTDGQAYTTMELLDTVEAVLGKKARRLYLSKSLLKIYSTLTHLFRYSLKNVTFSSKKLLQAGYTPQYTLEQGLKEYVNWIDSLD
jgi:UDP-glucose 4-epimerase